MAWTVTAGSVSSGSSGPRTITLPSHSTGDLLLVFGYQRATTTALSITTATGWSTVLADASTGGTYGSIGVFYKKATSGSETNPVLTGVTSTNYTMIGVAAVIPAAQFDPNTIIDVSGVGATFATPTTPYDVATTQITTNTNNALCFVMYGSMDDNSWTKQDAAWTGLINGTTGNETAGTDAGIGVEYMAQATAGGTGTITSREARVVSAAAGRTVKFAIKANPNATVAVSTVAATTTIPTPGPPVPFNFGPYTFEEGTSGNSFTASSDNWLTVTQGSPTYSNTTAHEGSLSIKTTPSSTLLNLRCPSLRGLATGAQKTTFWMYLAALPSTSTLDPFASLQDTPGTGPTLTCSTAGVVTFGGETLYSSFAATTWYKFDLYNFRHSAGQTQTCVLSDSGGTVLGTASTSVFGMSDLGRVTLYSSTAVNTGCDVYYDDISTTSPAWEIYTATGIAASSTTVSCTVPTNVKSGDIIVARAASSKSSTLAVTTPATGYTVISALDRQSTGAMSSLGVYRVADGTEGGSTVTMTDGISGRMAMVLSVLHSTTPGNCSLDSTAVGNQSYTSSYTSSVAPAVTTTAASDAVLQLNCAVTTYSAATPTFTTAPGVVAYTKAVNSNTSGSIASSNVSLVYAGGTGSYGSYTGTWSYAQETGEASTVAFKAPVTQQDATVTGLTTVAGTTSIPAPVVNRIAVDTVIGSTQNLCTNPDFELSTLYWTANTGTWDIATLDTSTTQHYLGSYSMRITYPTSSVGKAGTAHLVPLISGRTYTFSAYVYVPTGSPDVAPEIWFAQAGTATSVKDAWTRISLTWTANSTGNFLFGIANSTAFSQNQVFYVDAVQIEEGWGATPYSTSQTAIPQPLIFTGTSANVSVSTVIPTQSNKCTNGSFETDTTGWSGTLAPWDTVTLTSDATRATVGSKSMKVTYPTSVIGTAGPYYVTPTYVGTTYTMTAKVYVPAGSADIAPMVVLGGAGTTVTDKDQWVTASYTFTADFKETWFGFVSTSAYSNGQAYWVDDVQIVPASATTIPQPAKINLPVSVATVAGTTTIPSVTVTTVSASFRGWGIPLR